MSMAVAQTKRRDALRDFRARWERTRDHWDDPARKSLDDELVRPMDSKVFAAHSGIGKLAELFATARRECSREQD
ncbi:MAG: hypothetical protein ACK48N_10140 [Planctomyces sp.]